MSFVNDNRGTRIVAGIVPALYDKVLIAYPDAVTEVYSFYYENVLLGICTLIYDVSNNLISAERTG